MPYSPPDLIHNMISVSYKSCTSPSTPLAKLQLEMLNTLFLLPVAQLLSWQLLPELAQLHVSQPASDGLRNTA